jgi:hypothetical protein
VAVVDDELLVVVVVVFDDELDEHAASKIAVTPSMPSTTHLPLSSPMTTLSLAELRIRVVVDPPGKGPPRQRRPVPGLFLRH